MKNYKVILKKKDKILPEEKIKKLLYQSGFTYAPKINKIEEEKKLNENNINDNKENRNEKTKENKDNKDNKDNNNPNKNFKNKSSIKLSLKIDSNSNFIEDKMN